MKISTMKINTNTEIARPSSAEWKVLSFAMQKHCSPLISAQSGDKLSTERQSIVAKTSAFCPCLTFSNRQRCVGSHAMATLLLGLRAPGTHWIGGWDSSKDMVAKRKNSAPLTNQNLIW